MNNKRAFTIAEVLITLGIIGTVAALTIPNLIIETNEKELKTAFKSAYSNLSNATAQLKADNGGTLTNFFSSVPDMRDKYAYRLNISKSCDNSATGGCWPNTWQEMRKTGALAAPTSPGLILANGTVLVFEDYFAASCNSSGTNVSATTSFPNVCSDIMVDINGSKKPNVVGKDIFYFWVLSDSLIPWGTQADDAVSGSIAASTTCATADGGWGCAALLITNTGF